MRTTAQLAGTLLHTHKRAESLFFPCLHEVPLHVRDGLLGVVSEVQHQVGLFPTRVATPTATATATATTATAFSALYGKSPPRLLLGELVLRGSEPR